MFVTFALAKSFLLSTYISYSTFLAILPIDYLWTCPCNLSLFYLEKENGKIYIYIYNELMLDLQVSLRKSRRIIKYNNE